MFPALAAAGVGFFVLVLTWRAQTHLTTAALIVIATFVLTLLITIFSQGVMRRVNEIQRIGCAFLLGGAVLFGGANYWAWLAYKGLMEASYAMIFGVSSWLLALVCALPVLSAGNASGPAVLRGVSAIMVALGFVLPGASAAASERPMSFKIYGACAELVPDDVTRVSYLVAPGDQPPSAADWEMAPGISYSHGIPSGLMDWPAVVAEGDQMYFLAYGSRGEYFGGDKFPELGQAYVGAVTRILALGHDASLINDDDWESGMKGRAENCQ
ncbi:hypothetical protein C5B85_05390 [Pseudoclavibacter sp. AY1F1]|nr:hypothetical protein C5B85_05390 [Pseudoclavibacter sp. AY1F1]